MPLPVTRDPHPGANPVVWLTGIVGVLAAAATLTAGWPWYGALALFVALIAAGVVTQHWTTNVYEGDEPASPAAPHPKAE